MTANKHVRETWTPFNQEPGDPQSHPPCLSPHMAATTQRQDRCAPV